MERLHLAGSIIMGDNIPLDANGQADPGRHDGGERAGFAGGPRGRAAAGPG